MQLVREQPERIGHIIESAVVDRVEGNIIVLYVGEQNEKLEVTRQQLGLRVREGDHLKLTFIGHELNAVEKDAGAKARSRLRIQEKLNRLRAGEHLRAD